MLGWQDVNPRLLASKAQGLDYNTIFLKKPFYFILFYFILFYLAMPMACGSSQARVQTCTTAVTTLVP